MALEAILIILVVGAWLVHFLIIGYDMSAAEAGALAFALFGISAVMRDIAGRMTASGASPSMLVIVGLALGAGGLVLLGEGDSTGVAVVSLVLMAIGLSLPYPL